MRKFFLSLILVISFTSFAFAKSELNQEDRAYFPAVIMYHDIRTEPLNYFDILVNDFCAQLDWLKANDYETLSLEDFAAYIRNNKPFPEKSVLITFDDGYNGIYNYAFPELKKRDMKATFFITASVIDKLEGKYPHVTTQELQEIASDKNFSIGSHTMTHSNLMKMTHEEKIYELRESKRILEHITGREVLAMAYPEGNYDKAVIESVKESGYEIAFAVQDRGLLDERACYSIPRIYAGMELIQDNHALFKEYVKNYKSMPPEAFKERWQPIKQY